MHLVHPFQDTCVTHAFRSEAQGLRCGKGVGEETPQECCEAEAFARCEARSRLAPPSVRVV